LRPVCHHLEEHGWAHVLFCWIADAMYWVLERTHHQRGGSLSGRHVLEVLRGIQNGNHLPAQPPCQRFTLRQTRSTIENADSITFVLARVFRSCIGT
jgi:hypothetical protein